MPFFRIFSLFLVAIGCVSGSIPIVMNTWQGPFTKATEKVWSAMQKTSLSALDAVTLGCSACEDLQCENTVGYGGSPDENGETTLDSMIFDGETMDMGAVAGLRRIKNAAGVARYVLEHTKHSLLSGDLATEFAKKFNFREEDLSTIFSKDVWEKWASNQCQPNFWKNVVPDPTKSCGPYEDSFANEVSRNHFRRSFKFSSNNHDTIGVIAIDEHNNIVAGTTTNGANHKIPGRVGDSPIPGAGAYADNDIGAAVATGDGDVMMRFLPSFLAVEEMRRGSSPVKAAQTAISRIAAKYPSFFGAVLACNTKGEWGAACNGMDEFPFSVASEELGGAVVKTVKC